MGLARRGAATGLLLLPGALVAYTAFNAGGFFAGTQGWVAAFLALVLMLRATLAENPFGGASPLLAVTGAALALLAGWVLLSASWSDAPARALLEFDRVLVYLLALLLFGTLPMTRARLRVVLWGLTAAGVGVCTVALITRLLPELWPIGQSIEDERLSYPITYWNTLGLLGALAAVACLHGASSEHEPRGIRVAAAAALPILAATVYLTFSRGAIAAGAIGLVAYLLLGRPRLALSGLLAAGPATALAVEAVYGADLLATEHPTSPSAVAQANDAAVVLGLCVAAAVGLRIVLLRVDAWVCARPPLHVPRPAVAAAVVLLLSGGAAGFFAVEAPGYLDRQYDVFVKRTNPKDTGDLRSKLSDPSSNGRVDMWEIAIDAWRSNPLRGVGAGTYQTLWNRDRPYLSTVFDGHSLYAESLAELGWVGLVLVLALVGPLLAAAALRIRGPDRALFAAALSLLVVWALRAAVDWDWEMPVVTLWVFCLGGAVLATARRQESSDPEDEPRRLADPPRILRVLLGLACLLLAVTPLRVATSQERLNAAVGAYRGGDCPRAIDQALGSLDAVGVRPEPRQVIAVCDLRLGQPRLALRQLGTAIRADPDNWELYYVRGVTQALLGRDPRPELRTAARLNPMEDLTYRAVRRFARLDAAGQWRREARRVRLPGL